MRTTTILLLALLPAATLNAQQASDSSTQLAQSVSATYRPLYTLLRADIERIPASNFMDVVNGAFPFVATDRIRAQDYSFVIDGAIGLDPQSLNLSQIASIEFYPQGTSIIRGSSVQRGTFVIKTITGQKAGDLYVHGGVRFPQQESIYTDDAPNLGGQRAPFAHVEAVLGKQFGKAAFSSAFAYTRYGIPTLSQWRSISGGTQIDATGNGRERYRLSNFGQWTLGRGFRLQAAVLGTLLTGTDSAGSVLNGTHVMEREQRKIIGSLGVQTGLRYDSGRFHNSFQASWSGQTRSDDNAHHAMAPGLDYWITGNGHQHLRRWYLSNRASYDVLLRRSFRLEAALQTQYSDGSNSADIYEETRRNGELTGLRKSWIKTEDHYLELTPALVFDYRKFLQAEVSYTFDQRKGDRFFGSPRVDTGMWQAAFRMDALSLLGGKHLSRLEIGTDYRERRINTATAGLLDEDPQANPAVFAAYGEQPMAKSWLHYLHAGFFDDRLGLSLQWIHSKESVQARSMTMMGIVSSWTPAKRNSVGLSLRGVPVQNGHVTWTLQANLYRDRYRMLTDALNGPFTLITENPNVEIDDRDIVRGGLQTWLRAGNFHLQATLLQVFDDRRQDLYVRKYDYFDITQLTNALAGYTMHFPKRALASLEINGVLQQFPVNRRAYLPRFRFPYFGVGLVAKLR
ncbi:hypothetical protein [Flaviaesturariibacter terrae]